MKYTILDFVKTGHAPSLLIVYDMLGNEVALLVDEEKSPGSYSVEFDASRLSSGFYIYKITAGVFSSAKKLVLIK
ncbi:MAG: T9SS type A sorting domain-containing protein [Ignavibacteriaceae bacterium]|nr:T9SS type A sorting domain-containing protein [Ignavibacteriaceae bacterium]